MIDKSTLILIGAISLIVVASVYFLVFTPEFMTTGPLEKNTEETVDQDKSTSTQDIEVPEVPTTTTTDPQPKTAVNCNNRQTEQETQECLNNNFQNCSPAFVTLDSSEGIETEFRITGDESSGSCGVKITLNKHPVSLFSGESMVCMYDNSNSFQDEVGGSIIGSNDLQSLKEGLETCEGSLADIMESFIESSN